MTWRHASLEATRQRCMTVRSRAACVLLIGACLGPAVFGSSRAFAFSSGPGSRLVPSDVADVGAPGYAVALSADGLTAVVGVEGADRNQGGAWVFTRSTATSAWSQGPRLVPSDAASLGGSEFGASVAISGDGDTVLIGAPDDAGGVDRSDTTPAGAAWVFSSSGSGWTQQGPKLTDAEKGAGPGAFGLSVALSSDGSEALVGGAGGAWVLARFGSSWSGSVSFFV
jgi:hypothetical protein